jgi:hypothetical protein
MTNKMPPIVAEHIAAVNAFDTEAIVATFAPDAYVNDNYREIWGTEAIRRFIDREFVGDHVTMEVREVRDHYGDIIVRARYDGTYDKTNLPDELILSSYFGPPRGSACAGVRRWRPECLRPTSASACATCGTTANDGCASRSRASRRMARSAGSRLNRWRGRSRRAPASRS